MAATSVLKLVVDDKEYSASLKNAKQGMQALQESLQNVGKTFLDVDQKVVDYARAIGQMETVSKSARGKISEMSSAFVELSAQYKNMTDQEKQSPVGKAMAESLDQLKERVIEAKNDLKAFEDQLKPVNSTADETGGILGVLKDKFTVNIDALKLFNAGLTAAKAALDVAKDAFFQNESNVDEWGRTVAASEGIYDSFLQSLNNGDFSGFLQRIGEVINKAKEAYNALDELNTRMTIINPERTKLQARATELKAIIRRQGKDSTAGQAAQTELKQLEGMLTQAFKTESQLNMNAFKAQVDKKLQDAGIKLGKRDYDFLMRTFSSDASYMAMKRGAKGSTGRNYEVGGAYDEGSTTAYDTRNMNQRLLDLFTDEWRKEYAPLLNAAFSARGSAASTMLGDARYLKSGGGGSGSGGGLSGGGKTDDELALLMEEKIRSQFEKVLNKSNLAADTFKAPEMDGPSEVWKSYVQSVKDGSEEASNSIKSLTEAFEELNKKEKENAVVNISNDAKVVKGTFNDAASAVGSLGSALNGLDDPAAKIAGVVAQAIANIALAFSSADLKDGESGNVWYWIAATAAGLSAMITTISSIKAATNYAHGGMIKGNSYSGDNVGGVVDGSQFVGLNAGELVLNASQQSMLANNLQNGGGGRTQIVGVLKGEDVVLMADRWGMRTGRGELLFGKNL